MSDRYVVPFNYEPANTVQNGNTNYTVPSGKYAKVKVSYNGTAFAVASGDDQATSGVALTSDSFNGVVEYWLNEGDTATVTTTAASASVDASNGSAAVANDETVVEVQINTGATTTTAKFSCHAVGFALSGSGTATINIAGQARAYINAEEYNVLS